jgi:alcohol dehydrogenase class IV
MEPAADSLFSGSGGADIAVPRRLVTGDGALERLGPTLNELDVPTGAVLLAADAALVDLGVAGTVAASLRGTGYDVTVYDDIAGEPELPVATQIVATARASPHVAVVGVGGGSAMDLAKLAAGLVTNDGPVEDYLHKTRQLARMALPLALVPTTAGTGAEASKNTIVTHEGRKFVVSTPLLSPTLAILDPLLTVTCPSPTTAACGMDALAHAVEATLSSWGTPITTLNALAAVRTAARWLLPAVADGLDLPARRAMLYAAHLAGLSINASTLLGHSMAYTIASRTHLPHGVTTAMALPYCMAYNAHAAASQISLLASEVGVAETSFAGWVHSLATELGMPTSLAVVGIGADDLPAMVEECLTMYPRPNNPAPFERDRLLTLYERFLEGDLDAAVEELG